MKLVQAKSLHLSSVLSPHHYITHYLLNLNSSKRFRFTQRISRMITVRLSLIVYGMLLNFTIATRAHYLIFCNALY